MAPDPFKLLPRLAKFIDGFASCFSRKKQANAAQRYVRGLLSDAKKKNMQCMWGRLTDDAVLAAGIRPSCVAADAACGDWLLAPTQLERLVPLAAASSAPAVARPYGPLWATAMGRRGSSERHE